MLDNFDNLQASWVTQGGKVGQLSLAYGANDMGSVMIEENVVRAAGASYCMDEVEIVRNIEDAGFVAEAPQHALRASSAIRSSASARCRGMLELATARADGDTQPSARELMPLRRRAARAGKQARQRCTPPVVDRRYLIAPPWVLPIAGPPIRDGWVAVDRGRIVAVGPPGEPVR